MNKIDQIEEVGKYRTKKESNVSKSNRKSKHKHLYKECLIQYDYEYLGSHRTRTHLASYCSVCGKIGEKLKDTIVTDYNRVGFTESKFKYFSIISDEELIEKYSDKMPLFHIDKCTDNYVDISILKEQQKTESEANIEANKELSFPKYYNYDYENKKYYEISGPMHDHYTYDSLENAWYEDILN